MKHALLSAALLLTPALALAQDASFPTGPVITEFGPASTVQTDFKIPKGTQFKVLYDTTEATGAFRERELHDPARSIRA